MEDSEIIALYESRNERAISVTDEKYGHYCRRVAYNVLYDNEAAEECVNDTWLGAWNAIPPQRPRLLKAFLGRITRNLAFDRYRRDRTGKRGGGNVDAVLSELEDCVSGRDSVEGELDRRELGAAISEFLYTQPEVKRNMFIRRYWYCDSVEELSRRFGVKPASAAVTLQRLRGRLKLFLMERGFDI